MPCESGDAAAPPLEYPTHKEDLRLILIESIFPTEKSQISFSARNPFLTEPIFPLYRFGEIGSEISARPPADIFSVTRKPKPLFVGPGLSTQQPPNKP